jgi:8-oxo-dGTP pyrophosphatase MutT (NUDIX family)
MNTQSIYTVGGIILANKKILVVRKRSEDERTEYLIPGGKKEAGESDEETLRRELHEELGVGLVKLGHFCSFDDIAVFENIPIHMEVYLTEISGYPEPRSEIAVCRWVDVDYDRHGVNLGSILSQHVVPRLIEDGLL